MNWSGVILMLPEEPFYKKDGTSALMNACYYGHLEIVKYLIEKSAKINIRNKGMFQITLKK